MADSRQKEAERKFFWQTLSDAGFYLYFDVLLVEDLPVSEDIYELSQEKYH